MFGFFCLKYLYFFIVLTTSFQTTQNNMGKEHLRNDKECENCFYSPVTMAYCPRCGQHNVETRQSFGHLVAHFAEDFTHYDSGFWKTIKYLLFRPAKLTKEYLEGKRQQYVPPVKLYIFISFITFLLPAILPDFRSHESNDSFISVTTNKTDANSALFLKNEPVNLSDVAMVNSAAELDKLKSSGKIDWLLYKIGKSQLLMREKGTTLMDILKYAGKLLPKVLFFYMPVFAFWLWLFHGKKRWYFFDHGIFTLHYFSFVLLLLSSFEILSWGFTQAGLSHINYILFCLYCLFYFFYFFRAHRRMYGETRTISRLKGLFLLIINMISILIVLIIVGFYSFITYH